MDDPDSTLVGEGEPRRPTGPVALARGAALGRYVVLAQMGSGGMGVVYSAFDPQLDRKVALKVLHGFDHGFDEARTDEGGGTRLLREAQALAKLSHPNVIPVHDVGTVGGAVFIAMEFVDGQTLGEWCELERPWRERVAMLVAAGRGIAAAHRAGIVHRDFKPDNVMIGRDGRPRVLDFGLARAADPERGSDGAHSVRAEPSHDIPLTVENTLDAKLTITGAVMGTPAYMAPEQHRGQGVDERSDQFAFCVSVYEAVYGQRPYGGESMAALAFQVCQGIIREPPKGSAVPTWLRKVLLRGLSVDPADRYPSMDALLRELDRDPVRKRRRALLGVGLVAGLAGLGALAQHLLETPQLCTGAAEHMVGVWDPATREAVHAAFVASEVVYAEDAFRGVSEVLDSYASEWTTMHTEACAATRIRGEQSDELLTLRMACLDRSLGELRSLVDVYLGADVGTVERALDASELLVPLRLCADVESLRSGVRPPSTQALREQVDALRADLDRARAQLSAGQQERARELLTTLREPVTATNYRPLIAEVELAYGPTIPRVEDQVPVLERAVWMAEASHHDRVAVEAWTALAAAHSRVGNSLDAGLFAVARADAAIERIGGDDELRIRLDVVHGGLFNEAGRPEQAIELLRQAHQARERAGQAGTPQALYELVALANVMFSVGEQDASAILLVDALPRARAVLGADHPWVARIQTTLARIQYFRGEFEAAEAALRSGVAVFERAHGEDSTQVAASLNGLALVLHSRGRGEESLAVYERALANVRLNLGPRHVNVAKVLHNIGNLERELGRNDASLVHLEECRAILAEAYGPRDKQVAFVIDNVGDTLLAVGRDEDALIAFDEAIVVFEAGGESDEMSLVYPLTGRALALLALGQRESARASFERADALVIEHADAVGPESIGWHGFEFAQLLWSEGEHSRARELATRSLAAYAKQTTRGSATLAAEIEAWLDAHPDE